MCKDTGAVSVACNMHTTRGGIDKRYSVIDACPRCAYLAEFEYKNSSRAEKGDAILYLPTQESREA